MSSFTAFAARTAVPPVGWGGGGGGAGGAGGAGGWRTESRDPVSHAWFKSKVLKVSSSIVISCLTMRDSYCSTTRFFQNFSYGVKFSKQDKKVIAEISTNKVSARSNQNKQ